MTASTQLLPLEFLRHNEQGRVVEIEGRPEDVHRLEEIGLGTGNIVRMIKAGLPCIVGVNGQRFSFRPEMTTSVYIELLPAQ